MATEGIKCFGAEMLLSAVEVELLTGGGVVIA